MELLYIVGGLIVLAFLWRGVSWLRDYQRRIRVRLEPVPPGPETVETYPELGKVRVRPRFQDGREEDDEPTLGPVIVVSSRDRDSAVPPAAARVESVSPATLREAVPSPAATVQAPVDREVESAAAVEAATPTPVMAAPVAPAPTAAPTPPAAAPAIVFAPSPSAAAPAAPALVMPAAEPDQPPVLLTPVTHAVREVEQHDMFADEMIAPPPMPNRVRSRAQALYDTPPVEPVRPVRPVEEKPHVDVQDVIALHVVARAHPFNGEDLLRAILSYGLRFGDMAIFHRHERPTGQGKILFSMAKAVEPGTFDLNAMTGEEIPGVSFFLSLPGVNSILAYDIMVDTAKRLATELQGELLDEQQQPLTRQLVEHYRERVQEFERRRLMQRPTR